MALKSYEELIKVDVRQYCEERDGFTYLNWAKCEIPESTRKVESVSD